jgi:predicted phage-related endonuclease
LGEAQQGGRSVKANEIQEGADWMAQRAGNFTASRSADLMARTKSGPSASRANLLALLAVERLTGECVQTYQNGAMARGIELEAEARDAYSFERGVAVTESGYVASPDMERTGCSPDGLLGDDGLLEIKCPASMQKHLEALRTGAHAVEYRWQLQHQLMVTGRAWVDVVSFDPRFPDGLQLAIKRVERDESAIAELRKEIAAADAEVIAMVAELQQMKAAA